MSANACWSFILNIDRVDDARHIAGSAGPAPGRDLLAESSSYFARTSDAEVLGPGDSHRTHWQRARRWPALVKSGAGARHSEADEHASRVPASAGATSSLIGAFTARGHGRCMRPNNHVAEMTRYTCRPAAEGPPSNTPSACCRGRGSLAP